MPKKILFICGSLNQTTIMHQIARRMFGYPCYFTPFYADGIIGLLSKTKLLDFTILGGRHRKATQAYLAKEKLPVDFGGRLQDYDTVVTCTDLIIQRNIRGKRLLLIQEGITEPENWLYSLVRYMKLPRFLANTAATGLSDLYDFFCVASPGYRDFFIRKGVKPEKIIVTGIPNFDNAKQYLNNDFPYKDYVLVATSSIRETKKFDDRTQFLREANKIAAGRQILIKLHPNEDHKRAQQEILETIPQAMVFTDSDINPMIANCAVLITQYSSVVYTGIALGKEVHSYYDRSALHALMPIQNGGRSAQRIAEVCKQLVRIPQSELIHFRQKGYLRRRRQISDAH